jgi:hypothetical protein
MLGISDWKLKWLHDDDALWFPDLHLRAPLVSVSAAGRCQHETKLTLREDAF